MDDAQDELAPPYDSDAEADAFDVRYDPTQPLALRVDAEYLLRAFDLDPLERTRANTAAVVALIRQQDARGRDVSVAVAEREAAGDDPQALAVFGARVERAQQAVDMAQRRVRMGARPVARSWSPVMRTRPHARRRRHVARRARAPSSSSDPSDPAPAWGWQPDDLNTGVA